MLTQEELNEISERIDREKALLSGMVKPNWQQMEPRYDRDYARFLRSQAEDDDGALMKGAKAVWNGTLGFVGGGVLGGLQALRNGNIKEHLEQDPNYKPWEHSYKLNEWRDNILFDVRGNTAAGQIALDLIQGAGQLATQIAVTSVTGGVGGALFTGAQIFGNQYADLMAQGADHDRSIKGSLVNAAAQGLLDMTGVGVILDKLPGGRGAKTALGKVASSVFAEGITEALQEFPEQFSNIYALNPNSDAMDIAREWDKNSSENLKSAAYSGILGGLLGGGVKGLGLMFDKGREVARRKLNITKIDDLGKKIHVINEQANLPREQIVEVLNVEAGEDAILIDAVHLTEYAQIEGKKLEDIAGELNISKEAIINAASAGQEVEIGIGEFAVASSNKGKLSGLYEAMKEYMSFKNEGAVNEDLYKRQSEDRKANYDEDTPAGKLQAQLNEIYKSAVDAKIGKDQWGVIETVLSARAVAYNADNPAEFFERHPIRFIRTVRTPNRQYYQTSGDKQIGGISFDQEGRAIINLYTGKNATTAMHEIGHYFFESLFRDIEGGIASDMQRNDFNTLLAYTGIDYDSYKAADFEGRRKTHENIAEAWESYLMEGKAPSTKLAKVFAKMKKWFLTVYSKLSRTPYALAMTDDVRQVFDRMLASEAEIEVKIRVDGHFEKLPKKLWDNLSDASKATLAEYAEKARETASNTLAKIYLANFRKETKSKIDEYKKAIQPEVEKSIANIPLYKAAKEIADNMGKQLKNASAKNIANRYINGGAEELAGLTAEQQEQFNLIAEMTGYANGGEFAQAIIDNPTYEQAVRQEIERRVQEQFPDTAKEPQWAKEEELTRAIYNEDGAELLALEFDLIKRKAEGLEEEQRTQAEQKEIAKEFKARAETEAKGFLETQLLAIAIDYRKYAKAEKNARLKYKEAVKSGDMERAAYWKYQQSYNYALVRQSQTIRIEIKRTQKRLKKIRNASKDKWGKSPFAYKHYNQVMALFERMGTPKRNWDKASKDQTFREYYNETKGRHEDNCDIAEWLLDESKPLNNLGSMKIEEYRDVADAIANMFALAKQDSENNTNGINEKFGKKKVAMLSHLKELPIKGDVKFGAKNKAAPWYKRALKSLQSADNFFLELDNWVEGGFFTRALFDVLKHANDNVVRAQNDIRQTRKQALDEYMAGRANSDDPTKQIAYKELGTDSAGNIVTANKFTLVQMLLNMGSDSNMRRLCGTLPVGIAESELWVQEGNGITKEQALAATRQNLIKFIAAHVDARDIKYAQAQLDIAGKYWEELRALDINTKGFPPRQVMATPILFELANGETVYFKGGYYPLVRDIREGSHPQTVSTIPNTEATGTGKETFLPGQWHTKARTNADYPVDLSENAGDRALLATVHDLYLRETMMDFKCIFMDDDLCKGMIEHFGPENYKLLRDMLIATANPYRSNGNGYADSSLEATADWLRRKSINAAIMLNLKVAIQNLTNIFLYGNDAEGFTHMDSFMAMWDVIKAFATGGYEARKREFNFCMENSEFMREKMWLPDISLKENLESGNLNPLEKKIIKFGTGFLAIMDMFTAEPVWNRAFAKKIEAGASMQEAKDFADSVIRRAIGSNRISEVAAIQRAKGAWKLFTMFQGFFITQFNQWQREYYQEKRLFKETQYTELAARFAKFATAKWLVMAAADAAISSFMSHDDDEGFEDGLKKELISYPLSLAGPYGQFASNIALRFLGYKPYRYRMSAIESVFSKAENAAAAPYKHYNGDITTQEMVEAVIQPAEIYYGVPYAAHNLFFYIYDYAENSMALADISERRPKSERE